VSDLSPAFRFVEQFKDSTNMSMDRAHAAFIVGAILAQKPWNVLELGVGTGYVTGCMAHALMYNQRGRLTSVDNWVDWKGKKEPSHVARYRKLGVKIVNMGEEEFVRKSRTDAWDMLVSDADHPHSHTWLDEHLRIVRNGGLMYFHDTNQPQKYPGLATIEGELKKRGITCVHFCRSSRADEKCERGLLFAVNRK
jgi:predicted O-methyltransferase YrrM